MCPLCTAVYVWLAILSCSPVRVPCADRLSGTDYVDNYFGGESMNLTLGEYLSDEVISRLPRAHPQPEPHRRMAASPSSIGWRATAALILSFNPHPQQGRG